MDSKVGICNRALLLVKQPTINAFTDVNGRAEACRLYYPPALTGLLEGTPWDFATVTAALVEHATAPPTPWGHRYQMPTLPVVVTPRELLTTGSPDQGPGEEYEIQPLSATDLTLTLLTNARPAELRYTFFHDDPTKYPAMFEEALVCKLAMRLDVALNQADQAEQDRLQGQYFYWLGEARKHNNSKGHRVRPDCGATKARL